MSFVRAREDLLPSQVHHGRGWAQETGETGDWRIEVAEDMLTANRLRLRQLSHRIYGRVSEDCTIKGDIVVEAGAHVFNSTLRGPLIIAAGSWVEGSYIGPYTAIGSDCVIRESEIEHTIVMERSQIIDVPQRIGSSIIGPESVVSRSSDRPKVCKLVLPAHSRVGIL